MYFSGDHHPNLPSPRPVILRKKTTWEGFEGYLRSYSSLHTFHEKHPEDKAREDGDIASRFMATLKEKMEEVDLKASNPHAESHEAQRNDGEVEIEWPLAVVMVKRS